MPLRKLESPFWTQLGHNIFSHDGVQPSIDGMHDCTTFQVDEFRNANIQFLIKVKGPNKRFHAALLFRKNGKDYIGVGIGGWNSYYSIFSRYSTRGFTRMAVGSEEQIQSGTSYVMEVSFRSGLLTEVKKDSEILFQNFSIRDSLACDLARGRIGIYAYDKTNCEIEIIKVSAIPSRCFVITNIEGAEGAETSRRRKLFENLLKKKNVSLEFADSRDLTREHPLMPKIKSAIIEADIVLVDCGLGSPRSNVYYETGIAHAVGVPTIHIGPSDNKFMDPKLIPSDMRGQFFILEHELMTALPETVIALLQSRTGTYNYLG